MAICPGNACKINWQWDWCQDSYCNADTGEFCTEQEIHNERGVRITLFKCTGCELILSVMVTDPEYGAGPFNHPDWDGVDWESKENAWPKQ